MTLLDSVRAGLCIYDLAHPLEDGTPNSPSHPPFKMALLRRHGDGSPRVDRISGANELITMGGHVGTHIDAFAHIACEGRLHGGVDAEVAQRGGRFHSHGVDTIAPMVCRGILLDVAAAKAVDHLSPAYGITAADLEEAADGREVGRGDVALIRTGWTCMRADPRAYVGHATGVPGPTVDAARWLAARGVRATGADTIAYEQLHPGAGHSDMPVHRTLLVERGVYIIEALNLVQLARDGVHEFLFVLAPLNMVGATGSPVRPLAVVEGEVGRCA
ncbi:MAG: hypothetical protein V7607_3189 [Solirubrobacteraceae bacterium]